MQINLDVKQNTDYDVIVAGGGPAGCTAAAAAARGGARTLLIESMGCLGGMGTAGLVPSWCPFSDKIRIIYKGLAEKVFNATKAQMPHINAEEWDWVPIDAEALKRVYDDMMDEYGVDVLFYTTLSHVVTDGKGNVEHILVTNKSGISSYKAKIYIDCTGDGDLAVWAGADYEQGGENHELQPATSCFIMSNVDEYAYRTGTRLHANYKQSPIYDIAKDDDFPLLDDTHACNSLIGPGTIGFNAGHLWGVDNTNVDTISKAMIHGRRQTKEFRDALAKYDPKAFANAFITATPQLMGIRETRRIIGDDYLTIEDYLERRTYDTEIARNCYYIDIHNTKEEVAQKFTSDFDSDKRYERYKDGESHGIPYGCLVPKGLNNVLMAGRMISTDRIVQGSTRVMPVCLVMGEAAGAASVMAAEKQDVRQIDVASLRETLREYDNYLP